MSFPWYATVVLVLAAASVAAAPALGQTPFDGAWNVTVLTKAGYCEPSALYPLTVSSPQPTTANSHTQPSASGDNTSLKTYLRDQEVAHLNRALAMCGGDK